MTDGYRPSLIDVARLVSGTRQGESVPEAAQLVEWLIAEDPELREAWHKAHERLECGLTLLDVAELHRALELQAFAAPGSRRQSTMACATAIKLLHRNEETRELWDRLEQMGHAAGLSVDWPGVATYVVVAHADVDSLLTSDEWTTSDECLDPTRQFIPEPGLWIRIVENRLSRRDGDVEALKRVRDKLRAEIAVESRTERESEI